MTSYKKGDRNPKEEKTKEIDEILDVSINSIRKYDYRNLTYTFILLEICG